MGRWDLLVPLEATAHARPSAERSREQDEMLTCSSPDQCGPRSLPLFDQDQCHLISPPQPGGHQWEVSLH